MHLQPQRRLRVLALVNDAPAPPGQSSAGVARADPAAPGAPGSVSGLECTAVLHRLGYMRDLHRGRTRQVRNRSCHLQAPVNAAA